MLPVPPTGVAWGKVKISSFKYLRQNEKHKFQSSKSRVRETSEMTKVHKEQESQ